MSASAHDLEYLDCAGVAAKLGIKTKSIWQYCWMGHMPDPDLILVGHKFWLVSTIDDWQKEKHKWYRNRRPLERREIPKPTVARAGRINVARAGARVPAQPKASRKRTRAGASARPATSVVAEKEAAALAAEFRAGGTPCTAADVMVLADHDGEGLEYERDVLRQRILQRLKAGGR